MLLYEHERPLRSRPAREAIILLLILFGTSRAFLGICSSNHFNGSQGCRRSRWFLVCSVVFSFIFLLCFERAPSLSRLFAYTNDRLMAATVVTRRCDRAPAGRWRDAERRLSRKTREYDDEDAVGFCLPKWALRCQGLIYAKEKKK